MGLLVKPDPLFFFGRLPSSFIFQFTWCTSLHDLVILSSGSLLLSFLWPSSAVFFLPVRILQTRLKYMSRGVRWKKKTVSPSLLLTQKRITFWRCISGPRFGVHWPCMEERDRYTGEGESWMKWRGAFQYSFFLVSRRTKMIKCSLFISLNQLFVLI